MNRSPSTDFRQKKVTARGSFTGCVAGAVVLNAFCACWEYFEKDGSVVWNPAIIGIAIVAVSGSIGGLMLYLMFHRRWTISSTLLLVAVFCVGLALVAPNSDDRFANKRDQQEEVMIVERLNLAIGDNVLVLRMADIVDGRILAVKFPRTCVAAEDADYICQQLWRLDAMYIVDISSVVGSPEGIALIKSGMAGKAAVFANTTPFPIEVGEHRLFFSHKTPLRVFPSEITEPPRRSTRT